MKKKNQALALEDNLLVDLTLHGVPASLLTEFAQKVANPYYLGNMNAAVQDLIQKTLTEQEFVHSRITHVRSSQRKQSISVGLQRTVDALRGFQEAASASQVAVATGRDRTDESARLNELYRLGLAWKEKRGRSRVFSLKEAAT